MFSFPCHLINIMYFFSFFPGRDRVIQKELGTLLNRPLQPPCSKF